MEQIYRVITFFLFRANIRIKIPAVYPEWIANDLYDIMNRVNQKYNSYRPGSVTDIINQNAGRYVEVDDETETLFRRVVRLSEKTNGAFDITIMPLLKLWGFYSKNNKNAPSHREIQEVLKQVNYKGIEIRKNQIRIGAQQEITTGGFLKSYAVDCLVNYLKQIGITDAIVNAGGSTIACMNNKQHPYWQVIVSHPIDKKEIARIQISNQCWSTSSNQTLGIKMNEKWYGHVMNPRTGYPGVNIQSGILTYECLPGDIISTALINQRDEDFTVTSQNRNSLSGYLINRKGELVIYKQPMAV